MSKLDKAFERVLEAECAGTGRILANNMSPEDRAAVLRRLEATEEWLLLRAKARKKAKKAAEAEAARCAGGEPA